MNRKHLAIYSGLVAAFAVGFALGVEYTGRMAIGTYIGTKPGWLATVQRTRWAAVAGFGVLGSAAAYLWGQEMKDTGTGAK